MVFPSICATFAPKMKQRRHFFDKITLRLRTLLFISFVLTASLSAWADTTFVHRVEADVVPSMVIQSNSYLRGANPEGEKIESSMLMRLKYTVQQSGNPERIGAYHGLGLGVLAINRQLGTPLMAYIVQGAPIVNLSRNVSLNYELNLGASFGWKAYDAVTNEDNHVLGSPVNVYIGADVFLRFMVGRHVDLNLGYGYTHYSNANLRMPNESLHAMGVRLSAACYFGRDENISRASLFTADRPDKRWVTDVVLYGGWKKKSLALPATFGVAGFQVSPMYLLNRAFAIGPSIDAVYDHSVNLTTTDVDGDGQFEYEQPRWSRQAAVGLQARAELNVPVFRASCGIGHYVGGFSTFYETLAMKVDVTRHFFLNIGYCLYNYNYTNNLMLGIGYRIR